MHLLGPLALLQLQVVRRSWCYLWRRKCMHRPIHSGALGRSRACYDSDHKNGVSTHGLTTILDIQWEAQIARGVTTISDGG